MASSLPTTPIIRIAAALLLDRLGRTLLVRKRGTRAFMQPGGKIERGESPTTALARELAEELGLSADPASFTYLGRFRAPAANERGWIVDAELYRVRCGQTIVPTAEIEEAVWLDGGTREPELAPLTRDHVLLLWRAMSEKLYRTDAETARSARAVCKPGM